MAPEAELEVLKAFRREGPLSALGAAGMFSLEAHAATTGTMGFADYGDALWWTAMLMTTIGSAYWPLTAPGRVLAFMLSVYSLGVFGYLDTTLEAINAFKAGNKPKKK